MLHIEKGRGEVIGVKAELIAEWSVLTEHMIKTKVFDTVDSVREQVDIIEIYTSGDTTNEARERLKELLPEDKMNQLDDLVNSVVNNILGK